MARFYSDASAGIVAMIHDNTELPMIDVAGIRLATGHKHKLGYKKKTKTFLSAPYTDCTTTVSPAMQMIFDQFGGADYAYSPVICYSLCVQAYMSVHSRALFLSFHALSLDIKNVNVPVL